MKMSKNLYMEKIGEKAKLASLHLSSLNIDRRNSVLKQFSQYLKIKNVLGFYQEFLNLMLGNSG